MTGEIPEVRVHAERHVGEVAEPGQDPRNVVDRQAVDEERADAHLLEAAGRAAEEVTLRRAPVLPVDAADAVTAATEAHPHGKPGLEQTLDRLERQRVANQGQRLEQDQIGRLILEHPTEEIERSPPAGRVDLFGDRERHSASAFPIALPYRLPREPDAEARDVHPVRHLGRARAGAHLDLRGAEDRPRVRRDDVAADVHVSPVHVQHGVRSLVERPRSPEAVVRRPMVSVEGVRPLKLRRDRAVEDHAALLGKQPLEPGIGLGSTTLRWRGHGSVAVSSGSDPACRGPRSGRRGRRPGRASAR